MRRASLGIIASLGLLMMQYAVTSPSISTIQKTLNNDELPKIVQNTIVHMKTSIDTMDDEDNSAIGVLPISFTIIGSMYVLAIYDMVSTMNKMKASPPRNFNVSFTEYRNR